MHQFTHESSEPCEIKNVFSFQRFVCEPKWLITQHADEYLPEEYYFFMDCPGEDAFAHWIFESFIFYPLLLEKLADYPTLKILTSNTKRYCKNFLKYIDVHVPIVQTIETPNNVVFFPPIVSLNKPNMDVFKRYITNYVANMSTDCISNLKLIYLPRNSRENYIVNEREEPFVPEITDLVIKKGGTVIDTYNINNISVQMALIQSASTIIVHYGSAFFVNCIHLKNKKIILLDSPVSVNQERAFDSIRYIHEYIKSRNTVFCIFSYTTDIKNILDRLVE